MGRLALGRQLLCEVYRSNDSGLQRGVPVPVPVHVHEYSV
jgi:hypothetical protein